MNPGKKEDLVTVTIKRIPRKGFIPPRRVTAGDGSNGTGSDLLAPKKKRNLSPLFSRIIKSLDEKAQQNVPSNQFRSEPENCDRVSNDGGNDQQFKDFNRKRELDGERMEVDDNYVNTNYLEEPKVDCQSRTVNTGSEEERSRYFTDGNLEEDGIEVIEEPTSNVFNRPSAPKFKFGKRKNNQIDSDVISTQQSNRYTSQPTSLSQCSRFETLSQSGTEDDPNTAYYEAVFGKATAKKHKSFESDGFIIISKGNRVVLKNSSGKVVESSNSYKLDSEHLEDGKVFKLGGKEVQVSAKLDKNPFNKDEEESLPPPSLAALKKVAKLPAPPPVNKPFVLPYAAGHTPEPSIKANKNPSQPLFNPDDPDAFVMPVLDIAEDVRVVVDPHLSRHLREHQREGVEFLYKCVMDKNYCGAILGDEMGLGKTLQCITLLWTLLKQGPYQRKEVVKRALIIAPSSLVSNWDKEFRRWLGYERLKVFAVDSDHPLKHCPPQSPVIIMSYEMATRSEEALKKMRFDIIVCDEAHKIKNRNGQACMFLSSLPCKRRVLLTGTPVQNDLMELYTLVNFANPGVLGTEQEFRKEYEKPIEKYQEPQASLAEKQFGQVKALQLNNILNNFFLRRTHNVMLKYLPPRVTYVAICKPSKLQLDLYEQLLSLNIVQDCVTGTGKNCSAPLSVILALKKLCNHPSLVHPKANSADKVEESLYYGLGKTFPPGYRHDLLRIEDSGKMKVLVSLLKSMKGQKVVVVSHYTQTLDLLENLCSMFSFTFKRLDGSTLAKQRQQIVDQFNNGIKEHIFLLSSKAGGLGLNLQGASNIILYDIDWNPAHDIQAMSRCWRPGQTKITNIYRLITSGTIEERIYHRQIAKQDLSGSVMDLLLSNSSVKFSPQDLKDIFSLVVDPETCLTHDLIECQCECDGRKDLNASFNKFEDEIENQPPPKKKLKGISTMAELNKWEHHGAPFENLDEDGLITASNDLQFVFCSRSLQDNGDAYP